MSKKYAFFPGCVLESAAKEDYLATVAVAKNWALIFKKSTVGLAVAHPTYKTSNQKLPWLLTLVTSPWLKKWALMYSLYVIHVL